MNLGFTVRELYCLPAVDNLLGGVVWVHNVGPGHVPEVLAPLQLLHGLAELDKKTPRYCKVIIELGLDASIVLILDSNSGIGTHVRSDLGYLICLRHLFRSRAVTNLIFLSLENTYFPSCVRNMF